LGTFVGLSSQKVTHMIRMQISRIVTELERVLFLLRVNESNTLVIVSTGYPDGQKQEIILSYPVSKAHSISHTTVSIWL